MQINSQNSNEQNTEYLKMENMKNNELQNQLADAKKLNIKYRAENAHLKSQLEAYTSVLKVIAQAHPNYAFALKTIGIGAVTQ